MNPFTPAWCAKRTTRTAGVEGQSKLESADAKDLVARIPLFAALDADALRLISRLMKRRRYRARQVIVWEGESGGTLFCVVSGYLKAVTAGAEGKEMLLSVMGPGDVFGELSVLDGEPRSASVVAIDSAELASIEQDQLRAALSASPSLALGLLKVLSQRIRHLSRSVESISSLDVPARIARLLITLAERHGQPQGPGVKIPIKLSQQDLGSMVGATRESVNKLLRVWTAQGSLQLESGRLVLTDFEEFRRAHGAR